jgi:hypothetical protein
VLEGMLEGMLRDMRKDMLSGLFFDGIFTVTSNNMCGMPIGTHGV